MRWHTCRGQRDLRKQCLVKLRELELTLPAPFTLDAFLGDLEHRRGRRLLLHPWHDGLPDGGLCGAWLSTGNTDHIYFAANTSQTHQRHIVLHEIAHMLWGHQLLPDAGSLAHLFPDLDPETVLRALLLQRAGYAEEQERQAEMMASLLGETADRISTPADLSGSLGRLKDVLSGHEEQW
ncbi:hypothetical protein ABT168_07105 [Streptomyces sp. NPDC001793]|uniref:hypothetical protein n=1 Tax=Streptomyces sp. NPDC001793 TaxID=3154657 RepID=UPI003321A258